MMEKKDCIANDSLEKKEAGNPASQLTFKEFHLSVYPLIFTLPAI